MSRDRLIAYLETANQLLETYGHCLNPSGDQRGLIPFFAVELSVLPDKVAARIATKMADPKGGHTWAAVSGVDRNRYTLKCVQHLEAVRQELQTRLGKRGTIENRQNILSDLIKQLQAS